ncbi:DbpA RNA binding domain-containing protein [Nannocystis sp.]|uniref:DbpA RNA binding domain-containing protein n=1 Tax=Nannocystis sp. TaxID=1962667 RepID=UPI0025DB51FB|nr:DbpA RNA binding domain-containing protein [Nannocystis sp.]MBK7824185.1 DbpA RNA binding domain-containing protein [Nannocystis sp.]
MAQDEIIIDIDENELEVVQSEFGSMDDEFDEFALMDRRQAVIETLQEEVELEDLSRSDASRMIADEEDEGEGEDEANDETDASDEPAVVAPGPDGANATPETESEADERKRKRRRRRKKAAPLVLPELTAPPHKDFWEVWASKYTYQDFEDGKYTPPNNVPEVEDEPPAAPVLADRPAARAPRPAAPPRQSGPRTSPPRAPRPGGPEGLPPRPPVIASTSSEADDGEFIKVCLNLGRSHGHKAATLRGLLRDHLGLEGRAIRDLTVRDGDTLFRVHQGELPRIQEALTRVRDGDAPLTIPLTIRAVEDHSDALRAPPPGALAGSEILAGADSGPEILAGADTLVGDMPPAEPEPADAPRPDLAGDDASGT